MTEQPGAVDVAWLLQEHQSYAAIDRQYCGSCYGANNETFEPLAVEWPCDAYVAATALQRAEQRVAALEGAARAIEETVLARGLANMRADDLLPELHSLFRLLAQPAARPICEDCGRAGHLECDAMPRDGQRFPPAAQAREGK